MLHHSALSGTILRMAHAKRPAQRPLAHARPQTGDQSLSDLVDGYQASGRYTFTRDEARSALGASDEALKKAVQRLVAKRRLAVPRRGFFVIVPIEYRDAGAPPASWFIDPLMKFHGRPYYVGLLSAAALHGAAHQQPQEFQVVTDAQLRPAVVGRARIRFFSKRRLERTRTMSLKTETGTMNVSTPEATALDLLRYLAPAGHLDNVATVLAELAERLEAHRLLEAAKAEGDLSTAQRLGYLLELVGAGEVAVGLAEWIAAERARLVPLRADRATRRGRKDARWRVLVNEKVEAEV
jgi:predicted transcriptional regulator of viral defense system